jgi:hypothetical protein
MDWTIWIQLGVPMVILVAIGIAIWRTAQFMGRRLFGDGTKDNRGYVDRWFAGEQKWRNALTERLEQQQELCDKHAACLESLDKTLQTGQEIARNGNALLAALVALHEDPGGSVHDAMDIIHATSADMGKMKRAANRACEMCRTIAKAEFPNSAAKVSEHCDEIERIIGEA